MRYKNRVIFISGLSGFIVACIIFFKIFEPIATNNKTINFSKRIAAEAGNIAVKIYDPYEKKSKKAALSAIIGEELSGLAVNSKDFKSELNKDSYLSAHLSIARYDNKPITKSSFKFDYQPYNEKKLEILRERYELSNVISEAKNEFDKILLIRNWVNSRWKFGASHDIAYNFNALDLLKRAEKGEKFFCSEYATVYIQTLASIGITARYIGLFKGHAVTEVWSDDYYKWIIMDPTFNTHYTSNSIPLNALELHNLWIQSDWKKVQIVSGDSDNKIEDYSFKLVDYYENFFIRMRNDWFTNHYPRWHTKSNSIMNGAEWQDDYTDNDIRIAREISKADDLYWDLNQTHVKLINYKKLHDKLVLVLYFDTITPNFNGFSMQIGKESSVTIDPIFNWQLVPGLNVLKVASFNKFGIKGKSAVISVEYN